ncbi:dihydropteroate synthase [Oxalobacter paraformigenes]|uniref:Dihydropteroate synthase n=1 Tax=Oxalobacter paraformigenes TaxID=556268 RepID=C3X1P1_9BURK|nr:dihydropteroate synthase [Oxalobacter paraformigenes]EEO27127.1 dihydropteroate synthase [Oxalobacter paraformigenes]
MKYFQCGRYRFELEGEKYRPLVMGILNVTPDSFSDGGKFLSLSSALTRAEEMIAEGVDIIDIGAESSRPGSDPVSLQEELDRVMPVVEALKDCGKPLSVDTYKPEVMSAALGESADMINDISGFRSEASLEAVIGHSCGLCVMHMQGEPKTMQDNPHYGNVTEEVVAFLHKQVLKMTNAGIGANRICVDPGFGFGKTLEDNLVLLKNMSFIQKSLELPVLAGLSRKSVVAALTGKPVEKRLAGNLAIALAAVERGAAIVRVHEVGETVDALKVWLATR